MVNERSLDTHRPAEVGPAGLGPASRTVVAALSAALPAAFRTRQRAEWTADLLILAHHGKLAGCRYLLGAAWTLPALRALARHAPADGPTAVVRVASPSMLLATRVLIVVLCWVIPSWLVMLPIPYLAYDISARMAAGGNVDPSLFWPNDNQYAFLVPLQAALYWGAAGAVYDFPLVSAVALVAMIFAALRRRRPWRMWLRAMVLHVSGIAVAATVLMSIELFLFLMTGRGLVLPLLGLAAGGLGAAGRGLSRGKRILLGVLGVVATAIVVIDNTFGWSMVVWFRD